MIYTTRFWRSASERAIKTWAQSLVALLGAGSVNVLTVGWPEAFGVSVGAGVLSLLTSIASVQVTKHDDPSLV